jgi:hypothetical protein
LRIPSTAALQPASLEAATVEQACAIARFTEADSAGGAGRRGPHYPVDEITIAGNLRAMFAAIEAVGDDVDRRSHVGTGAILVGKMTVAGES